MSTHAALLIKNPDASDAAKAYGTTLVHYDGYPTGIGYELYHHLTGTSHAADLLRAGNLNTINNGKLGLHDKLDQKPAEWFADLETAKDSILNGPAAYGYLWDGNKWHGINKGGRVVSIQNAKHL